MAVFPTDEIKTPKSTWETFHHTTASIDTEVLTQRADVCVSVCVFRVSCHHTHHNQKVPPQSHSDADGPHKTQWLGMFCSAQKLWETFDQPTDAHIPWNAAACSKKANPALLTQLLMYKKKTKTQQHTQPLPPSPPNHLNAQRNFLSRFSNKLMYF